MRTELIFTDQEIARIASRVAEKLRDSKTDQLSYGLIKPFNGFSLWFEPITDTKDGFVLRDNKSQEILGTFPECD